MTPEDVRRAALCDASVVPEAVYFNDDKVEHGRVIESQLLALGYRVVPAVTETDLPIVGGSAEQALYDDYANAGDVTETADLRVVARQAAYDTLPSDADDAMYVMVERAADAVLRALAAPQQEDAR